MGAQFTKNSRFIANDLALSFGSDRDGVVTQRTATLNADTAVANVIIGTPNTPALAANSLMVSNVTSDGDTAFYSNDGGNTRSYIFNDASSSRLGLYNTAPGALVHVGESTDGFVLQVTGSNGGTRPVKFERVAGAAASIQAEFGAGDAAWIYTEVTGGQAYAMGLDDGDSDSFVLSTGNSLGAADTNVLHVTTAGVATFPKNVVFQGSVGFFSVTPQAQQAHIVNADGNLADITTKFNTLLADLEGFGFLATS